MSRFQSSNRLRPPKVVDAGKFALPAPERVPLESLVTCPPGCPCQEEKPADRLTARLKAIAIAELPDRKDDHAFSALARLQRLVDECGGQLTNYRNRAELRRRFLKAFDAMQDPDIKHLAKLVEECSEAGV